MKRRAIICVATLMAFTCVFQFAAADTEMSLVVRAPYDFTQICYKVTWPPGTECHDRFIPAISGLLEVGGVRVIDVPGQPIQMTPHVSRMGAGTYFHPVSPGNLTVTAHLNGFQPANLLTDRTLVCMNVGIDSSCSDELTVGEITVSSRVISPEVLVEVYLLKPYTGTSALWLADLSLHFLADPDMGGNP